VSAANHHQDNRGVAGEPCAPLLRVVRAIRAVVRPGFAVGVKIHSADRRTLSREVAGSVVADGVAVAGIATALATMAQTRRQMQRTGRERAPVLGESPLWALICDRIRPGGPTRRYWRWLPA